MLLKHDINWILLSCKSADCLSRRWEQCPSQTCYLRHPPCSHRRTQIIKPNRANERPSWGGVLLLSIVCSCTFYFLFLETVGMSFCNNFHAKRCYQACITPSRKSERIGRHTDRRVSASSSGFCSEWIPRQTVELFFHSIVSSPGILSIHFPFCFLQFRSFLFSFCPKVLQQRMRWLDCIPDSVDMNLS